MAKGLGTPLGRFWLRFRMTGESTRLFQIREDDLAALEHTLPDLLERACAHLDNRQRVQWSRVRDIIANVRWNYGPPGAVEIIPAGDEPPSGA